MLRQHIRRRWRRFQRAVNRYVGPRNLISHLARTKDPRIVIGAGTSRINGWFGTDREFLDLLEPKDWERFFQPGSIAAMLAEHVWEHLTLEQGKEAAARCYTYLRPGGYLRVAVPDGLHPHPEYITWVRPGGASPRQIANDHKVLYTYLTLGDLFREVGFETRFYEFFDDSRTFHYADWNPDDGMIHRSLRFDKRNRKRLTFTSIIMDAIRPTEGAAP